MLSDLCTSQCTILSVHIYGLTKQCELDTVFYTSLTTLCTSHGFIVHKTLLIEHYKLPTSQWTQYTVPYKLNTKICVLTHCKTKQYALKLIVGIILSSSQSTLDSTSCTGHNRLYITNWSLITLQYAPHYTKILVFLTLQLCSSTFAHQVRSGLFI